MWNSGINQQITNLQILKLNPLSQIRKFFRYTLQSTNLKSTNFYYCINPQFENP
jgi:hypothetical protein